MSFNQLDFSYLTGNVSASQIANTAVTPGTYGGVGVAPVITVDQQGRLTYAANASLTLSNTSISGLITNAQIASVATSKLTGNISSSQLANTTVTPGTYGGSGKVSVVTVDQQGRITTAANVALSNTDIISALGYTPISADGGGSYSGPRYQLFQSGGTFTVPAGVSSVKVTLWGGGGGGGGGTYGAGDTRYGGNGGNGGAGQAIVSGLTPGSTINVTVGAGGDGGYASSAGRIQGYNGGSSSFGNYVVASGGVGGTLRSSSNLPPPSNGDVYVTGAVLLSKFSPIGAGTVGSVDIQLGAGGAGGGGLSGGGAGGTGNGTLTNLGGTITCGLGFAGSSSTSNNATGGAGGGISGGAGGNGQTLSVAPNTGVAGGGGGGGGGGVFVEW